MKTPKIVKKIEPIFAKLVLSVIAFFTKFLYKSLRIQTSKETLRILADKRPCALFAWHDTISMLPLVNSFYRNGMHMVGLMSSSKDGDYIAYIFSRFGVLAERGSSSKNGARSAVNLIKVLRSGGSICITPDGPRGPKHKAKDGMILVCEKSPDTRIVFVQVEFYNSWKFKSWDEFNIPKPFSKVKIEAFEYENVEALKKEAVKLGISYIQFCEKILGDNNS